jgi:hypothetical protein
MVAAALALAAPASAATVSVSAERLTFRAAPGEANDVSVEPATDAVVVRDAGAPLTAGDRCITLDRHAVSCPLVDATRIVLRDGDDLAGHGERIDAGPGDDTIARVAPELACGAGTDLVDNERFVLPKSAPPVPGGGPARTAPRRRRDDRAALARTAAHALARRDRAYDAAVRGRRRWRISSTLSVTVNAMPSPSARPFHGLFSNASPPM